MVDVGDLVLQSETVFPDSGAAVIADLNDVVKYKVNGSGRQKSSGLSMFVPLSVDKENARSLRADGGCEQQLPALYGGHLRIGRCRAASKLRCPIVTGENVTTETMTATDATEAAELNPQDYPLTFHTELDDNGSYQLMIDSGEDIIQSVAFNLYFESDDGKSMLFLGTDYDINYDEDSGVYSDNFRNVWPTINGETCSMLPLDWGDDYILYTVPVKLNGNETNLRMLYDLQDQRLQRDRHMGRH